MSETGQGMGEPTPNNIEGSEHKTLDQDPTSPEVASPNITEARQLIKEATQGLNPEQKRNVLRAVSKTIGLIMRELAESAKSITGFYENANAAMMQPPKIDAVKRTVQAEMEPKEWGDGNGSGRPPKTGQGQLKGGVTADVILGPDDPDYNKGGQDGWEWGGGNKSGNKTRQ